ncbi:MAG: hypothetical protein ACMXYM_04080 [Candidatus Woesearchaeota archaeon]
MRLVKPVFLFCIALALLPVASAIGATGCGAFWYDYEPYGEIRFSHGVINAYDYTVTFEGVWNDSITLTTHEGNRVQGYLTMPPNWDRPGTMTTYVVFTEVPPPSRQGTAIGLTAVKCPMFVRVPYPGEYLEFDLRTADINEGAVAQASYFIASRGDDVVDDARLAITVEKNTTTYATYAERLSRIHPRAELRDTVDLGTQELDPGIYSVVGRLTYGTEEIVVERRLRVGELDVEIANYTRHFEPSEFTRINFTFRNLWNNPVDQVTLTYRITNEGQRFAQVRSETFSIPAFGTYTLRSIAETPGVVPGTSFIEYTLRFDGNEKSGTLPIFYERTGTDLTLLLLVLSGLLLTITAIVAVFLMRRKPEPEPPKKRTSKKRKKT